MLVPVLEQQQQQMMMMTHHCLMMMMKQELEHFRHYCHCLMMMLQQNPTRNIALRHNDPSYTELLLQQQWISDQTRLDKYRMRTSMHHWLMTMMMQHHSLMMMKQELEHFRHYQMRQMTQHCLMMMMMMMQQEWESVWPQPCPHNTTFFCTICRNGIRHQVRHFASLLDTQCMRSTSLPCLTTRMMTMMTSQ
jgi:hypothetical protein